MEKGEAVNREREGGMWGGCWYEGDGVERGRSGLRERKDWS
jgi:hypothetical protein